MAVYFYGGHSQGKLVCRLSKHCGDRVCTFNIGSWLGPTFVNPTNPTEVKTGTFSSARLGSIVYCHFGVHSDLLHRYYQELRRRELASFSTRVSWLTRIDYFELVLFLVLCMITCSRCFRVGDSDRRWWSVGCMLGFDAGLSL